jgi:hypothetical protein
MTKSEKAPALVGVVRRRARGSPTSTLDEPRSLLVSPPTCSANTNKGEGWQHELNEYKAMRTKYLLYP